jgi:site-specific DNA-methyltransferase (adenine-specific)
MGWQPDLLEQRSSKSAYEWEQGPEPMRELLEWLAPPGALVCDPMAGVGTYGVAALKAGCRFLGCELDTGRAGTSAERLVAVPA